MAHYYHYYFIFPPLQQGPETTEKQNAREININKSSEQRTAGAPAREIPEGGKRERAARGWGIGGKGWREKRKTHIGRKGPGETEGRRREAGRWRGGCSCWLYGHRLGIYCWTSQDEGESLDQGGGGVGRGPVDINNNYWFEPLSVRDLSNLKITSEINYVRLISPGLRSVYRRGYYTDEALRSRVCAPSSPSPPPLQPLLPSPPVSRGRVVLLSLPPTLLFSSCRIMSSAPAHARISVIMWSTTPFIRAGRSSLPSSPHPRSLSPFSVLIVGKFFYENKETDRIIRRTCSHRPGRPPGSKIAPFLLDSVRRTPRSRTTPPFCCSHRRSHIRKGVLVRTTVCVRLSV